MAIFSDVVSAWRSTTMSLVLLASASSSRSMARNGQSMIGMKTRPWTLTTATSTPLAVVTI